MDSTESHKTPVLERPVLLFGFVALVMFVVVGLSAWARDPIHFESFYQSFPGNPWLTGWTRWDAHWYGAIANEGYWFRPGEQSGVAFFPLYPHLMRWLSFGQRFDPLRVGYVITLVCGCLSALLFWRWCETRLTSRERQTALLTLLLFPTAFFLYGAVYSDALFLLLSLAAFSFLEKDQPWLAGMVAGLASASRPVGLALVLGLWVRCLELRGAWSWPLKVRFSKLKAKDTGLLLAISGGAAYMLYLGWVFGDFFAVANTAQGWGQSPGPHTWLKYDFFARLAQPFGKYQIVLLVHAALTFLGLSLVPRVVRRFGWGYGLYALVCIAIPAVSSKDFMGMGRYLLAAFPCFAMAGELLSPQARRNTALAVWAVSAVLLIVGASEFANWAYVS